MTWEQKLMALKALGECALRMRSPADWYLSVQGIEIKNGGILGGIDGNGKTPQEAVENAWHNVTEGLKPGNIIVKDAYKESRRHVRWNGYMWEDLSVK